MSDTGQAFIDYSRDLLTHQHLPRIDRAVAALTDEQIWSRPNDASNSVGNLRLHLAGNVRQWIVTGIGGAPGQLNERRAIQKLDVTILEAIYHVVEYFSMHTGQIIYVAKTYAGDLAFYDLTGDKPTLTWTHKQHPEPSAPNPETAPCPPHPEPRTRS